MQSLQLSVLLWVGVIVFAATGLITLLALVGVLRLGGDDRERHNFYLKALFTILIVEIVGASSVVYSQHIGGRDVGNQVQELVEQNNDQSQQIASRDHEIGSLGVQLAKLRDKPAPVPSSLELMDKAYATSDKPQSDTASVKIPAGWEYVDAEIKVWSKNGDAKHEGLIVKKDPTTQRVTEVSVKVSAKGRSVFGRRNWIGIELHVKCKK